MFSADLVWGLAVAADAINGGYYKDSTYRVDDKGEPQIIKQANKLLVKDWLRSGSYTPTAAEIAAGQEIRNYFKGFLFRSIAGQCNDFEATALRIAQKDEFTGRDLIDFSIVSCLPAVMLRDAAKVELKRAINDATQLRGNVGDTVQGEIEVIASWFSQEYNKYKIRAKLVDSFVDFWYNKDLVKGSRITIKGKIKAQRDDNTTQLNYVKKT